MIFVSACLLGENCKYSGGNNYNKAVADYLKDKEYLPICPECAGGLPSPRPPAEIQQGRVIDAEGHDVTEAFQLGAEIVLKQAFETDPTICILKANSPSCGVGVIYDGTFTGRKVEGYGLTAALLRKNGFRAITEKDLEEYITEKKGKTLSISEKKD